jgi:hypothetical protein
LSALEAIVKHRRIEPDVVLAEDPEEQAVAESGGEDDEPRAS